MPQILRPDADVSNPGNWKREVTHSGTAQAGTATTITLASSASASDDFYNGDLIDIVGGTGSGQERVAITDYVGATKVATVASWPTTTPDSTSQYEIYEAALWPAMDDNLATLIRSVTSPSNASVRFGLEAGIDPQSTGLHRKYVSAWKNDPAGARQDLTHKFHSATNGAITSHVFTDLSDLPGEQFYDLTTPEINLITEADYEGLLEEEFIANQV